MVFQIIKVGIILSIVLTAVLGTAFLIAGKQLGTTTGKTNETVRFTIHQGEGVMTLGERLEAAGVILNRFVFLLYVLRTGQSKNLQAGEYLLAGSMSLNEVVERIVSGKIVPPGIRITFPEGWTIKKMAERLTANGLPGEEFREIATKPDQKWRIKYSFLTSLPDGQSLEGYLFPDTYIFPEQSTGELIVNELLNTYGKRTETLYKSWEKNAVRAESLLNWHQLMTLASIVESEVRESEDRRMVADLFLRRLSRGQALQSCATLGYVLGTTKVQYSIEETQTVSPYNTYMNPGLPPGPIGNPGIDALQAVLNPLPNPYYYFLNNPTTGETVFSRTFEEHVLNKAKNGL